MPLISVIVPVYNVEPYLCECLDSVLAQTFKDIEVICVNDGSTDGSLAILEEYAARDRRFSIITKANGGLSSARNVGMDVATGKYLYFLDSDDMLVPDAFEKLVAIAERERLDFLIFTAMPFADKAVSEEEYASDDAIEARKQRLAVPSSLCDRVKPGAVMFCEIIERRLYSFTGGVPLRLFRRGAIPPSLRFPEGLIHEDEYFAPLALIAAKRVFAIPDRLYLRRVRSGSIMFATGQEQRHANGYFGVWGLLRKTPLRPCFPGRTKNAYSEFMRFVYRTALLFSNPQTTRRERFVAKLRGWGWRGVIHAAMGSIRFHARHRVVSALKVLARIPGMWRLAYLLLRSAQDERRFSMWQKCLGFGIASHFPDKGFWIINTFVYTGEKYIVRGGVPVGGIYSAINWQRINWRSELPTRCTDKLAVRDYVRSRIGDEFLIPILPSNGTFWTSAEDVDFDSLPNRFVLKLNNGSGMNLIVKDKNSLDIPSARRTVAMWLASRFSTLYRERQYDGIENKLYCEAFLETPDGNPPDDYKIMCNNGKPLFIWVDTGRNVNHQRSFFDLEFRKLDVRVAHDNIDHEIPKPKNLDKMLEIASKLSAGIPIVRIDLYNINGKIYFGEMTFSSAACTERYEPLSFSIAIGNKIDLSHFI